MPLFRYPSPVISSPLSRLTLYQLLSPDSCLIALRAIPVTDALALFLFAIARNRRAHPFFPISYGLPSPRFEAAPWTLLFSFRAPAILSSVQRYSCYGIFFSSPFTFSFLQRSAILLACSVALLFLMSSSLFFFLLTGLNEVVWFPRSASPPFSGRPPSKILYFIPCSLLSEYLTPTLL